MNVAVESMFPEEFPPLPPKRTAPWKPTKDCEAVLGELSRGPRGEDELFNVLAGDVSPQRVVRALDALAKNGMVRDTGRRSNVWRDGGRCWIWELATTPASAAGQSS